MRRFLGRLRNQSRHVALRVFAKKLSWTHTAGRRRTDLDAKLGLWSPWRSMQHVCVDMQRLFAEPSQWATPWITRVLPQIERLVERRAPQTVFTRFLPARKAGQGVGTWKRSYERWAWMTIEIGPEMAELLPSLAGYCPPAAIIDKHIYSPWFEGSLRALLMARDTGHHGWRNRCMRSGHSARGHRFRLSRGSGYGRAVQLFRRNPRRAADRLSSAVRATGRDSRDGDRSIELDVNPPCRQGLKLTRPDR